MFSNTIIGNITYMEVAVHEGKEFLAITVAVNDRFNSSCRVKFNNSNGLLTAYINKTLVVGQQLILSQYDVRIDKIRTHYLKDGKMLALKCPELTLTGVRATIGALPKAANGAAPKPTISAVLIEDHELEEALAV